MILTLNRPSSRSAHRLAAAAAAVLLPLAATSIAAPATASAATVKTGCTKTSVMTLCGPTYAPQKTVQRYTVTAKVPLAKPRTKISVGVAGGLRCPATATVSARRTVSFTCTATVKNGSQTFTVTTKVAKRAATKATLTVRGYVPTPPPPKTCTEQAVVHMPDSVTLDANSSDTSPAYVQGNGNGYYGEITGYWEESPAEDQAPALQHSIVVTDPDTLMSRPVLSFSLASRNLTLTASHGWSGTAHLHLFTTITLCAGTPVETVKHLEKVIPVTVQAPPSQSPSPSPSTDPWDF